ncbi:restriction endonuclease subunit S [Providencia rettgeri]|uniref:restriction endonuclease subunit S n=1 Tax=Providencia rettgeri TaxID=587 RepID=UPI0018E4327F|nr:restriction endonuclease subunit S [Providencia rettgeri]MBI6189397.1 restriction endonuclease subunit S [Providencia rettgeri]
MVGRYKAYPEYNDSGVEWLERLPLGWKTMKVKFLLKDGSEGIKIGPFGSALKLEDMVEDGIRVYGQENVIKRDFTLGKRFISQEKYDDMKIYTVEAGDILVTMMGTSGKCQVVPENASLGIIDSHLLKLRVNSKIQPELFRLLVDEAQEIKNQISKQGKGSIMHGLNSSIVKELEFPLPSLEEQIQILSFLNHEIANIDTLIAKQEKLIELLKEKRQAVISNAVTKGLNPDVPMKDSGVEWLGDVPEHWVVLKLKHLIQSLESGCSVNAADTPAKTSEIGVLKTSCVYTRRFRVEENKTVLQEDLPRVKCPIRKGAIIISRMNTPELVGASALVNVDIDNIYLPDRLWQTNFNKSFDIEAEFLAYFMTVEGFRNQISLSAEGASSSMQNIAKEDYLAINAILPQLKEQIEIVNYIKKNEAKFLRLEAQVMNTIELLKERKTALISAAVTGKIDVRDWQPKGIQE